MLTLTFEKATWLALLLYMLPIGALAQDKPLNPELQTLTRTVIYGNTDEATYAAATLFRKKADVGLKELLQRQDVSRSRRLEILAALKVHGRDRAVAACEIVRHLIMSQDEDFRKRARSLIVSLEPLSGATPGPITINGTSYQFLQQALLDFVSKNLEDDAAHREASVLLDLLISKQDPVAATKVLIDIHKELQKGENQSQKSAAKFFGAVERALETVTGVTNVKSWEAWFKKERQRSRTAWLMRRIERMKSNHKSREAQLEEVAATVFKKLITALNADKRAQLSELQIALRQTPVVAIRVQAVELLGELAKDEAIGEQCVETLTTFLAQQNGSQLMKNAIFKALGESGRNSAVAPLVNNLKDSPRDNQLVLIEALAKLKSPAAITPLKETFLHPQLSTDEPNTELLIKVIQALEQIGQDPSGKISSALIEVVTSVLTSRWKKLPTEQQRSLLEATAAALGRLDYEDEATALSASQTLQKLIDSPFSGVRFFVADSLSRLKFVDVRKSLEKLANDQELSVRQAAVRGLGRWALLPRSRDQRRDVVATLVGHFTSSDTSLHNASRTALTNLINDEDNPIGNLVVVTETLDKRERIDLAYSFLQRLDAKKIEEVQVQWLFEARARAALKRAETAEEKQRENLLTEAQNDISLLMSNPNVNSKARLRRLQSQLYHIKGQTSEAAKSLMSDLSIDDSWTLFLQYLKALKAKKLDDQLKAIVAEATKNGLNKEHLNQLRDITEVKEVPAKAPTKTGKTP